MDGPVRKDGRRADQPRPVTLQRRFLYHAAGSVLYSAGKTRVLCAVNLVPGVPPWLEGQGQGWATAEYAMLPASVEPRQSREGRRGLPPGRSVEIQRLIGRALRAVLDLSSLPDMTVQIDCDVLDADGSTRAAAITGAYVALSDAVAWGMERGQLPCNPLVGQVVALSAGIVAGTPMVDLCYEEDFQASFDCTVVLTRDKHIVEVQGTAEETAVAPETFTRLLALAIDCAEDLFAAQDRALREDPPG